MGRVPGPERVASARAEREPAPSANARQVRPARDTARLPEPQLFLDGAEERGQGHGGIGQGPPEGVPHDVGPTGGVPDIWNSPRLPPTTGKTLRPLPL